MLETHQRLRRVLHLDGSLGGRERADLGFCLGLVLRSLPTFNWDLTQKVEERTKQALSLPSTTLEDLAFLRGVAFLEVPEVEVEILRAHPDLLNPVE